MSVYKMELVEKFFYDRKLWLWGKTKKNHSVDALFPEKSPTKLSLLLMCNLERYLHKKRFITITGIMQSKL